jgi:signal transduction histidine kinase
LRSIDAFSKFLMDEYYDRLDETVRHQLDVIRHSAVRMLRLINDLLQFSRLSQQKRPLETVSLNKLLMHVRDTLDYAITAKQVNLRVGKLPKVLCDATAMTAVFHNLISNAIKYNHNPAPLVVVGAIEAVNPQTQLPEDVFFVRDNGLGIPPDAHERIFQIFQRLQRDEEGTGIGLAIVKRVIEWHGGRIWLESEEGRGSTFFFALPKRPVSATEIEDESPPEPAKGEPTIAPTI